MLYQSSSQLALDTCYLSELHYLTLHWGLPTDRPIPMILPTEMNSYMQGKYTTQKITMGAYWDTFSLSWSAMGNSKP